MNAQGTVPCALVQPFVENTNCCQPTQVAELLQLDVVKRLVLS